MDLLTITLLAIVVLLGVALAVILLRQGKLLAHGLGLAAAAAGQREHEYQDQQRDGRQ